MGLHHQLGKAQLQVAVVSAALSPAATTTMPEIRGEGKQEEATERVVFPFLKQAFFPARRLYFFHNVVGTLFPPLFGPQ